MPITLRHQDLQEAAQKGTDAFLALFTDAYRQQVGNVPDASTMGALNGWQHSLLAYHLFREEVMDGGFVQLIQNGFGGYIFKNPFAKALRLMGATELSKLVYKAKEIYEAHQADLEKETDEATFLAMYEQYEAFDELEERFFDIEETCTETLARYVDEHLSDFVDAIEGADISEEAPRP